mgnify:CR=1 FL=1
MNKKYSIFLTVLFSLFLGGILVGSFLLPDKEFSELENRYLAKPPKLSVENLETGKFMEDAEDYVNDHIIGRDFWVALKAWSERLSGKQENNGVYFGKEDTLLNRLDEPDPDVLQEYAGYVNALVDNVDVPVYFGIIPSSSEIWSDRLPAGAPTADEKAIIDNLYDTVQTYTIDLYSALEAHKDEEIYYRTDHHWTSLGAFYGANALLESLGREPLKEQDFTPETASTDFNGTLYSQSGIHWLTPDTMEYWVEEDGLTVTSWRTGSPEPGMLYDRSYLDQKDKYSSFLGGNQPLCVIRNENARDGGRLLLIRDSYSDALAPFLAQSFDEVHLLDLRYYRLSPAQYAAENGIDQICVVYSVPNFITDRNLVFLAQ